MPDLLDSFLAPEITSLKICGITTGDDAAQLAALGVPAMGVNFWPRSKRYCAPESAATFLPAAKDRLLRVGVFVNPDPALVRDLLDRDLIDLVQFHGDESPEFCRQFGVPFLKAIGVESPDSLATVEDFGAAGILLDAHAPGDYGGTGRTIDWSLAASFVASHPDLPVILAGGITPANAAAAMEAVRPAALDVASGAEDAPGIKNFEKVKALLAATRPNS